MSDGRTSGNVTRRKTSPRRAERAGGFLETPVGRAEGGFEREHEKRHGHEGLRHDRASGGERQVDTNAVELGADEAASTEGEEQSDTTDNRGQHHRQRGERPHERLPRYSTRACTHASGTPRTMATAVADSEVTNERRRASSAGRLDN